MNNNTRHKLRILRKTDPAFFTSKVRVRPGHAGKVSCLTYDTKKRIGT